jgi:hypothetical protein
MSTRSCGGKLHLLFEPQPKGVPVAYPATTQVSAFLQFARDEIDNDPMLLPCDPASFGKCLAFLNALVPAFHADQVRVIGEQANSCELLRQGVSEGVRDHLRGGPKAPAPAAPSTDVAQ